MSVAPAVPGADHQTGTSSDDRRAGVLSAITERLLRLFGAAIPEPSRPTSVRFAPRIDAWRARIRTARSAEALEVIGQEVLAACEAHADRFTTDLARRESEVADLVGVLREVIESLRGESRHFETELHRSTTTMRQMVDVEDIREIKRVLKREVDAILRAAAERQAAESKRCERLATQVDTLQASLREARSKALTDVLTGVPNRGAFEVELGEWLTHRAATGRGFALAMVDLDDLKKINDTHGHQVGDRVLIACAQVLQDTLPAGDVVTRYGGEEFAVLLQTPSAADARAAMQAAIARIPPTYHYTTDGRTRTLSFSFSAGVTEYAAGDTAEALIKRADDALYVAKRRGKKRVAVKLRGVLGTLREWAAGSHAGSPVA